MRSLRITTRTLQHKKHTCSVSLLLYGPRSLTVSRFRNAAFCVNRWAGQGRLVMLLYRSRRTHSHARLRSSIYKNTHTHTHTAGCRRIKDSRGCRTEYAGHDVIFYVCGVGDDGNTRTIVYAKNSAVNYFAQQLDPSRVASMYLVVVQYLSMREHCCAESLR